MGQHFTLGAGPAQIMGQHGCTAVAAYVHNPNLPHFPWIDRSYTHPLEWPNYKEP